MAVTAATCIAVGNTSLLDWLLFTSSFGCTERALATFAAKQFARAIGQHLIDVHVRLRAAAGLPDHQRELACMVAGQHLVGGSDDRVGLGFGQQPE